MIKNYDDFVLESTNAIGGNDNVSVVADNGDTYIFSKSTVEYHGVTFPIYIHEGGDVVATEELAKCILDKNDNPVDEDARIINGDIFLYIPFVVFNDIKSMANAYASSDN